MVYRRFSIQLGLRIAALTLTLAGWVALFFLPGFPTVHSLLTAVVALQAYNLFRFVSRTNAELTRFLDSLRYTDFSQRFNLGELGAGFGELGEVFTAIGERFQGQRERQEQELRHLRALTEHVPVPLLSLHTDGRVHLHNNAARRLFGNVQVTRVEDLAGFGEDFLRQVRSVAPGERRLARLQIDDLQQQLTIAATELVIAGRMEKLVSLQNIQSELDGVQLQAWQDLVRVLTHEIMNSITPVSSLAKTAAELIDDTLDKVASQPEVLAELRDVKDAVDTVARRSDGLMHFVQSYRRLTRLPAPQLHQLRLTRLFANIEKLVGAEWEQQQLQLSLRAEPESLELTADADMVEQVLLNILQNARQALAGNPQGRAEVLAYLNRQGHVCIDISDNGPGISPEIAANIFVPFFTTKREGSGVGLALTRQVMLAHGGSVTAGARDGGGARFTLNFATGLRA